MSLKLQLIRRLVNVASDFPDVEDDLLKFIRKVATPEAKPKRIQIGSESLPALTAKEIATAKGNKVLAIREYRQRTSLGLKEAKDVVEQTGLKLGFYSHNSIGFIGFPE
jgi:hypothetical protein